MESRNLLGDFLRARRELVQPEDVGLTVGPRRRVLGLRREEVAMLAGISAEYYLRLEQGRDKHPSEQVVEALARALQLDHEGLTYALTLARSRTGPTRPAARPTERVPVGTRLLLESINVPAFVMNRYRDVVASNPLAVALEPSLHVGANRILSLFTDPQVRAYHPDWSQNTASVVAQLRADIGADDDDPRFQSLVGELSMKSERFRQLWARHDVKVNGSPSGLIDHPVVGELTLLRQKFSIVGADRLTFVAYHAEPGSVSAERLAMLASLSAPSPIPDATERTRPGRE
ncbi:helix-turn-helix transcriptional regulator [Leifsonia sp. NPDC080035]|uniref:Helix-turn-helix transcriptional regulator n=1 Tax=Leifsonia sp. NPDC080035 TaxID=3143936 RepID=A0AAU7GFU4_9MICO